MAAMAPVAGVNWTVLVEQPVSEAFAPIYNALWRTAGLLLLGAVLAAVLAYWLARRMAGPIRLLEEGSSGSEPGSSTTASTSRRATNWSASRRASTPWRANWRCRRSARTHRPPQALSRPAGRRARRLRRGRQRAGRAARRGRGGLLDLRGFTAFSNRTEPDEVMSVLRQYYRELGPSSTATGHPGELSRRRPHGAGQCAGAMPRSGRARRRMAVDMQAAVQSLIEAWRQRGHHVGFGVGLAMGKRRSGEIETESRAEYTAIRRRDEPRVATMPLAADVRS